MLIKEVASPIDLRKPEDAAQWANEVNIKRPWRYAFFDYYAELIQQSNARNVLEIGAGPGYLAKHLLERCPNIHYTAFDFSEAMHDLSRNRLLANELQRTRYVVGDFKQPDWVDPLTTYDVIIMHQALHELRHKAYAMNFHHIVKTTLLNPNATYLLCDHLFAESAMTNNELYMSKQEHLVSLQQAGFTQIEISLEIKGLCVFKCH